MAYLQEELTLVTSDGTEVQVRKRGTTAPGIFVIRRKGHRLYVEFKYFVRGSANPQSLHIGAIVDPIEDTRMQYPPKVYPR